MSVLTNSFAQQPQPCEPVETAYRRIVTPLPVPASRDQLARARTLFPAVNCYQPPIIWDRAEGFQVYDAHGNCWIDFSSTAVMTNSGHGHPAVRAALAEHVQHGLLAQFSFASDIRIELAQRLIDLAPAGVEKVYFWTTGSEAIESAFRLVRQWGLQHSPDKVHVLCFVDDYHGCTLAAHQLSGSSSRKPWLSAGSPEIHHLPFPCQQAAAEGWSTWWQHALDRCGVDARQVAGVFFETLQGWGALPWPAACVQAIREWADRMGVLLVFDEVQTGFGRTGKWFAHEHYAVRADLICIGKGVTSSLPLAAVLGPANILDQLAPGEVTTTHAGHPLSCAAAMANLKVLQQEELVPRAAATGQVAREQLGRLQQRWPGHISRVSGLGLLNAIHLQDPQTGEPSLELARDLTWQAVRRGVMLFQTNRPSLKICPPLVITPEAVIDGIRGIEEALQRLADDRW